MDPILASSKIDMFNLLLFEPLRNGPEDPFLVESTVAVENSTPNNTNTIFGSNLLVFNMHPVESSIFVL